MMKESTIKLLMPVIRLIAGAAIIFVCALMIYNYAMSGYRSDNPPSAEISPSTVRSASMNPVMSANAGVTDLPASVQSGNQPTRIPAESIELSQLRAENERLITRMDALRGELYQVKRDAGDAVAREIPDTPRLDPTIRLVSRDIEHVSTPPTQSARVFQSTPDMPVAAPTNRFVIHKNVATEQSGFYYSSCTYDTLKQVYSVCFY